MLWAWIFAGIAVAGLVAAVCYGVWLAHKAADLASEIRMLGRRGEEIQALLGELRVDPSAEQLARARRDLDLARHDDVVVVVPGDVATR